MSKIHIERLQDEYKCEACGVSYAEGARVSIDGEIVLELEPHAHCYNDQSYTHDQVYFHILKLLGHSVAWEGESNSESTA
jgi:hypothetical protein